MSRFDDYRDRYTSARLRREDGILEITLTTDGGPLVWGEVPHRELPLLFADVGADHDNEVVILTGTGDVFCVDIDRASWTPFGISTTAGYDRIYWEGKRLLQNLLDIEVPVIGALNGPARIHAELALLSDVTIAADTTVVQDAAHYWSGSVPGDGVHVVWPLLLGPNRGRYFLMTAQELSAQEALRLGVVNEICAPDEVLPRAWELARRLRTIPRLTRRYTRVALTQHLKERLQAELSHGLILESAAIAAATEEGYRDP